MRNEQDFAAYVQEKYQAKRQQEQRMRIRLIRGGATLCACAIIFVGATVFLTGRGKQGNHDGVPNGGETYGGSSQYTENAQPPTDGPTLDGFEGLPADATAPTAASAAAPGTTSNNTPPATQPSEGFLGGSYEGTTSGQPPLQEAPNLDIAFENHFSDYAIPDRIAVSEIGGSHKEWNFLSEQGGVETITRICDWVLTESFTEFVPNTTEPATPQPPAANLPSYGDSGTTGTTDTTYYFRIYYGETQIQCTLTKEGVFQMNDGPQWQVSPDAVSLLIGSFFEAK